MQDSNKYVEKMKKYILLIFAIILCNTAFSQKIVCGFGGFTTMPLGQFSNNIGTPWGFSFSLGYRFQDAPIMFGVEASTSTYASRTNLVPYTHKNYQHQDANRIRSNNLNLYQVFTRFYIAQNSAIQPYADLRLGLTGMRTVQEYRDPYQNTNNQNTSSCHSPTAIQRLTLWKDNAFNCGGGIGVQANLTRIVTGNTDPTFSLLLDFRASYLYGGKATYQNIEKNDDPYNNRYNYTTNTSMITYALGIYVSF